MFEHIPWMVIDPLTTVAGAGTGPVPLSELAPLQGEEFCDTEAGGLIEAFVGIMVVMFFVAIVVALFAAAGIEALPMTGWWNQMGYSMMGKIPIAVGFVFIGLAMLGMVDGTFGISAPPCVPVVG
jgi:hypothetical protein